MCNYFKLFFLLVLISLSITWASAQELILAVNEGVTYPDEGSIAERYRPLTDILAKALKRPVRVKQIQRYVVLNEALLDQKVDFAFVHPAHVALRAVDAGRFIGIATARGFTNYHASVLVKAESPLKSIADLKGSKVGVPAMESITTVMFSARLKDLNVNVPSIFATTYQEGIPFMVANNLVDAGVTGSATIAKDWIAHGGRVIDESNPIAIKQFLVSTRMTKDDIEKIRVTLLNLENTPAGRTALTNIKMTGFVKWDDGAMLAAISSLRIWECAPISTPPKTTAKENSQQLIGSL